MNTYYLCTVLRNSEGVEMYANFVIKGNPIEYLLNHGGDALDDADFHEGVGFNRSVTPLKVEPIEGIIGMVDWVGREDK